MGYTPEHREATRERILEAAQRIFRSQGYERAKIEDIMAAAGLTRGGFYHHFESKQDLFAASVGRELEFTRQLRLAAERSPDDPRAAAADALAYYLEPGNRRKIARGCTVVSNAADMARARAPTRRAFTRVFRDLAHEFEQLAAQGGPGARARGLSALATCVGGGVLARALADEALIADLLEACREGAARELDAPGPNASAR